MVRNRFFFLIDKIFIFLIEKKKKNCSSLGVSLEFLPPSHMTYGDVWATVTVDQLDSNTEYVGKACA